jgi:DNA-binding CsgD family transcriptional regulator
MAQNAGMHTRGTLRSIALDAADLDDARRQVDLLLRRRIGYDVGAISTVDPASGLWTSCYVSGLDATGAPERERILYELDLAGDINSFAQLAARDVPAATLHAATDGKPYRARRWAPLLEPLRVVDEARAVLRTGAHTWGSLALYRAGTARPFTPPDLATLAAAIPGVAALLRLMLVRLVLATPQLPPAPPGAFTVLPDGTITGVSASARVWLDALDDRGRVPAAVRSVAAAAHATGTNTAVSVPSRRGGFVSLYGSAVEGSSNVAVVIAAAPSAVVADVLAHAYGLTEREREVAAEAALGKSTRDIAGTLRISPFTVTDHLKSLYGKVGVNSRAELVAALNQQNYRPRETTDLPTQDGRWHLDHNVG